MECGPYPSSIFSEYYRKTKYCGRTADALILPFAFLLPKGRRQRHGKSKRMLYKQSS